jgi:hypothetical protein
MSLHRNPQADNPRRAIVSLPDGRIYEGTATIQGNWVHFAGQRRINQSTGVRYCDQGEKTWPGAGRQ